MEGARAKVIILEDDEGVARLQQKRLQQAGYAVQTFAQPAEAEVALRGGDVDLMILDYRLADQRTGLEFYEELRRSGIDVPAILVTGFANESLIITALRAGMKDFVSKSAEYLDYLPEAVGRVLRQRQIERSLAETEARFETVFHASPIGIAVSLLADGRFVDANDAFLAILGCGREELVGRSLFELGLLPRDHSRAAFVERLRRKRSLRHLEVELRNCQGREIVIELSAEVINLHGTECLLSLAEDVTQRRHDEELLLLQHRAMNATSEGIVIADAEQDDLPLVFANAAFEQVTGYAPAEVLGRNCRFLQGSDTDQGVVAELREAIRLGRGTRVEILNYRQDGRAFWNQLSVTPVRDSGGRITHFVGILHDITERRLVAEQLRQSQKMEAIGRLAGGIAHDFNNILTIILGNTELALEDLEAGLDCQELLHETMQAGQRAAALTRQLLAFSRRQVLEPRVIDLNAVVTDAERLLRRLIGADVLLDTSLDPKLRTVKADPVQLEQILLNLTVNSRDAMPSGGRLFIETRNIDLDPTHVLNEGEVRPGPYVMLAVSDTGHGMDARTRSRIFEPFFTTKERGRGTGMGLSTVYGIVQQSGGYIWVYSEVGHGTTFKIYLPEHGRDASPATASAAPRTIVRGSETLLLVEDDTAVRALAKRMLEAHGYRVLEARHGADGLEVAAQFDGKIHLLVTDVIMPGMNGRQLAEALVKGRPETRVLYISGYTDQSISHHGVLDEGVALLQKPFSHESLSLKVREVLDAKPSPGRTSGD